MKKYIPVISAAVGLVIAIFVAVAALRSPDPSDDLPAIEGALEQATATADAAAGVAADDGSRPACIAAKAASALSSAAASAVKEAGSSGACVIPALEIDITGCPDPDLWTAGGDKPGVDVPAVVEAAIGPVLTAVSGMASAHENKDAGKWVAAALDFVGGGRKSIIAVIEDPTIGKLTIPEVVVQDCSIE
jgi:hypothetical protein